MRIKIHSAFTFHCNSKVPKKYKRNEINTDHFRSMRIASEMEKEITLVKKNLREQYSRLGHAPIRREKDAKREINMKGAAQRIYVFAWEIFTVLSLTKFRRLQTTVSHIKGREILHKMTFFSQLEKKQRQSQIISDSLNSFTKYLFL